MSEKISNISKYLDSTFLKTAVELEISNKELETKNLEFINQAIDYNFKCVMLRPKFVSLAKKIISDRKSKVNVGTVIDFPLGDADLKVKLKETALVIKDGADELDFVCDYNRFKMGEYDYFDNSIVNCTRICVERKKIIKWIIETGALSKNEIKLISKRIYDLVLKKFTNDLSNIFIKTSTGYYGGFGATIRDVKSIKLIVSEMPIKASGGISDLKSCLKMIEAGASRIGTSKALIIYNEWKAQN